MQTFGQQVIDFTRALRVPELDLPDGFEWIFPYDRAATMDALTEFYLRFYPDAQPRTFIFGINPGRFGSGITGVPFTDPIRLAEKCAIPNDFQKKPELSSDFVYRFIEAFGGLRAFCERFYITSIVPLGFVKAGKNINYYDDRSLKSAIEPFAAWNLETQIRFGCFQKSAICLGEGENFKFFKKLNERHGFFEKIYALPHPRWVMQYRRKRVDEFVEKYLETLALCLD